MKSTKYVKTARLTQISLLLIVAAIMSCYSCSKAPDVLVEKGFLIKKLGFDSLEKASSKGYIASMPFSVLDSLYDQFFIDTVFINDHRVEGFKFQIESHFLGYAKINYDSESRITSVFFYNQFDLNILKNFRPSTMTLFFKNGDTKYLYDSYSDELFFHNGTSLSTIKKGW